MPDLLTQITEMIAPITDLDPAGLTAESTFEDIDEWSSLKALSLMVNVEQDLPVRLDLRRFVSVRTVGELVALIAEGLGQPGKRRNDRCCRLGQDAGSAACAVPTRAKPTRA